MWHVMGNYSECVILRMCYKSMPLWGPNYYHRTVDVCFAVENEYWLKLTQCRVCVHLLWYILLIFCSLLGIAWIYCLLCRFADIHKLMLFQPFFFENKINYAVTRITICPAIQCQCLFHFSTSLPTLFFVASIKPNRRSWYPYYVYYYNKLKAFVIPNELVLTLLLYIAHWLCLLIFLEWRTNTTIEWWKNAVIEITVFE